MSQAGCGMFKVWLGPYLIFGLRISVSRNRNQLVANWMGKRPITEIRIATIICCDYVQPKLKCLR
jgi:hypothetical protein